MTPLPAGRISPALAPESSHDCRTNWIGHAGLAQWRVAAPSKIAGAVLMVCLLLRQSARGSQLGSSGQIIVVRRVRYYGSACHAAKPRDDFLRAPLLLPFLNPPPSVPLTEKQHRYQHLLRL